MENNKRYVSWGLFVFLTVLTILLDNFGWAVQSYETYLAILAVLSVFALTWALLCTGFKWWSILIAIAGLLIGQWWFVEGILMKLMWNFKGFV